MSETVYDILRTFHLVKNVQMGMGQDEWISLINCLETRFEGAEE